MADSRWLNSKWLLAGPCASAPCQNNGTCTVAPIHYLNNPNFLPVTRPSAGQLQNLLPTSTPPSGQLQYRCLCRMGFSGQNCQTYTGQSSQQGTGLRMDLDPSLSYTCSQPKVICHAIKSSRAQMGFCSSFDWLTACVGEVGSHLSRCVRR